MADTTQAVDPTKEAHPGQGLTPTTAAPSTTTTPGAQDGDKDKDSTQTGAPKKVEELPDWAQTEIKNLRKEAADRRKAATDAETAAKAKDDANLAANAQWKELADKRGGELDALKPKAELADRLSEIVAKQLETEIAGWPESVRAIMPDAESPLLERLGWAERTRPLAQELLVAQATAQGNGNGGIGTATPGLRFPAQHPGGGAAPVTTKTVAENTLNKAYAPRKVK